MSWKSAAKKTRRSPVRLLALALLLILPCSGCRSTSGPEPTDRKEMAATVRFEGRELESFPTAGQQLAWALSLRDDRQRQAAALRYVLHRFGDNRQICGRAALEIASLALGPDFRLAPAHRCREALDRFAAVVRRYGDLPEVAARGLWYQGWILTDLLHRPGPGLDLMAGLAERFPDAAPERRHALFRPSIAIPVQREAELLPAGSGIRWADLALLFIVERTDDRQQRLAALQRLLQRAPSPRIAGLAIRHCLRHPPVSRSLFDTARSYLDQPRQDALLRRDIAGLLRNLGDGVRPGAGQ